MLRVPPWEAMLSNMRGTSSVRYDWTPDVWSWEPDNERWSPAHGPAPFPTFLEVSTDGVSAHEAYDFWREAVFYNFDADRPSQEQHSSFCGLGRVVLTREAEFYSYRSDAVSGGREKTHIEADGRTDVELGVVLSGHRRYRLDDDSSGQAGPGAFFVFDEARPCRVAWDAHSGMHLSLRREAVEAALGCPMPSSGSIADALGRSRLAPVLKSQFALISKHMDRLDPGMRGFLLHQTAELALYAIGRLGLAKSVGERERAALFAAAQRIIETHYGNPAFGVAMLVQALGCSRATLYRAFADHGMTVVDAIRNIRLTHARRMLEVTDNHVLIANVALRCGFEDPPNFNRAFRRRFGMSPSEARHRARDRLPDS
ncbi:AraC family transcriptional regulator [Pseudaminobacter salicylatoxidans]|uniref:AraC family transcriptional regulator n=2 Tax=Pseudaminobacter salicylatoxidans TaxID=93369 RepID=A0A316C3D0_PSESE|nr:AraC family transcriptional regulator [Pseudaminobacter salicylatoxidans]